MTVKTFIARLRRFGRSEDGAVLPLIGLSIVVIIASIGLAIDGGRAVVVHSRLLSSADAAGLAVGARMNSTDTQAALDQQARKFVKANFPAGYAGSELVFDPKEPTATVNADKTVITVKAAAKMPTTLLRLVGVNSVDLNVTSEVTRSVSGLELVLALDNTGSMSGSKLASLKSASKDLLNILFGDKNTVDNLYVGVVPFSQAVNVGPSKSNWLASGSLSSKDYGPTSWAGCTEARSGRDTTDDPPSVAKFQPYYWPDDGNNDWTTPGFCYFYYRGSCIGTPTTYNITSERGPNRYCSAPVTPMSANKSTVVSAIDAMNADGNTHINLGAVWGWRMLSPRWRGLWGGDMDTNNLPLDYGTPRMSKAIVIMTDGENTMSSNIYTAYQYLSDGQLGTTSSTSRAETELDSRLTTTCNNLKNNNIIVYTIAFGSVAGATQSLLQNCATKPEYFFSSPSSTELSAAFRTIGDSLSNLRVSR